MVREALINTSTGLSAIESFTFVQEQEKTLSWYLWTRVTTSHSEALHGR